MSLGTFDEVQFPPNHSRGAVGGPVFSTTVTVKKEGSEQRFGNWEKARHEWNIGHLMRTVSQANDLLAFFAARRARLRGFRFKDWNDYQATNEVLAFNGHPTVQLIKTYSDTYNPYVRNIYKVVSSPVATFRKDAGALGGVSLNVNTGIATLPVVNAKSITAITKAATAIITVGTSHGFGSNDYVYITGVVGMTEINGLVGSVITNTTTTITVNINTSGFSTYTSGGTSTKYGTTLNVFDWTGEFDVPVRFGIDEMMLIQTDFLERDWTIPIIEIRGTP